MSVKVGDEAARHLSKQDRSIDSNQSALSSSDSAQLRLYIVLPPVLPMHDFPP